MSKVGVDAVTRNYFVKPRLEYRTLQGVNGPLVILEVRPYRTAPTPSARPPARPREAEALLPSPREAAALSPTRLPPLTSPPALARVRRMCATPSSPRSST